jgi:UDP-N-acetylglucosamine--N-acetylmuramyl-(pentapeptide) pyrophosphoryl-undecaprenol N-acetylglucosamine transferase
VGFESVVHVAGRQGAEGVAENAREHYRGLTFTDDMAALLADADLLVGRAGVGTIAESAAVGLPMVLVPGTFGGGHQEENAAAMVDAGAAVRIGDAELTPDRLLATIDSLTEERLHAMAKASRATGRRDAATRVLSVLREVVLAK